MTETARRHAVRRSTAVYLVLLSLLVAGCSGVQPSGAPTPGAPPPAATSPSVDAAPSSGRSPSAGDTARIIRKRQISGRMWDITIRSPAVAADVPVRLLLPAAYAREPRRRWPVLYLLHGCCDSYLSWSRSTDVAKLTRDSDVLVVMPDGGRVGFYSNWREGPQWETFHLTELPAILARDYRAAPRQAVAGVSMGGLGALGYAARHPGSFAVAASLSGIVDTRLSDDESQGYLGLVRSEGADPYALWGDPDTDEDVWQAHNPSDLAPRLAGTRLFVSGGDGRPGPLDRRGTTDDQIETGLRAENDAFAARVKTLRLDAQVHLYQPGTHNWVYWQREFHRAWPLIRQELDR